MDACATAREVMKHHPQDKADTCTKTVQASEVQNT